MFSGCGSPQSYKKSKRPAFDLVKLRSGAQRLLGIVDRGDPVSQPSEFGRKNIIEFAGFSNSYGI
jgi:hypothetical protein